jgi:hypothetical protein
MLVVAVPSHDWAMQATAKSYHKAEFPNNRIFDLLYLSNEGSLLVGLISRI